MRRLYCILLVSIVFCLTGCVKYNVSMDIKEDKSMNFSIIYALQKDFAEMSENGILSDGDKNNLEKKGFTISDYSDDEKVGFLISKTIPNIDDVSLESSVEYSLSDIINDGEQSKMFQVEKNGEQNIYIANFVFDYDNNNMNDAYDYENNSDDIIEFDGARELNEEVINSLDLKLVVKLPNAAIKSNATSKSDDGKELTWILSAQGKDSISFEFALNNSTGLKSFLGDSSSSPYIIGTGVFLVVVFGLAIINLSRKRKSFNGNSGELVSTPASTAVTSSNKKESSNSVSNENVSVGTGLNMGNVLVDKNISSVEAQNTISPIASIGGSEKSIGVPDFVPVGSDNVSQSSELVSNTNQSVVPIGVPNVSNLMPMNEPVIPVGVPSSDSSSGNNNVSSILVNESVIPVGVPSNDSNSVNNNVSSTVVNESVIPVGVPSSDSSSVTNNMSSGTVILVEGVSDNK